jgi:hypothetical protein
MTAEVFFKYIANVFHLYLVREGIKFSVVMSVDGHKSHLTYQLSFLSSELETEVIALSPNATPILQPADVAVFRPSKVSWWRALTKWCTIRPGEVLNKVLFAPLPKKFIESSAKPETLAKVFRASGLYPFNPNALDYRKCLVTSASAAASPENSINTEEELGSTMNYSTFVENIGKEKIEKFERIKDFLSGEN